MAVPRNGVRLTARAPGITIAVEAVRYVGTGCIAVQETGAGRTWDSHFGCAMKSRASGWAAAMVTNGKDRFWHEPDGGSPADELGSPTHTDPAGTQLREVHVASITFGRTLRTAESIAASTVMLTTY